ncbi:MAG: flagella basal body P-ring formation protein FlgA [Ignavibacteria bacterium]|nr:MAG: flagella basal body P-ring formation protein FlgA [Ignavibacteria bacterium]
MNNILIYILSFIFIGQGSTLDSLERYLTERFTDYNRVEFELIQPKDIESFSILENSEINRSGSYVYLPAIVKHKDGKNKREIISVKVKLYKTVLVARSNIKLNSPLNINDFIIAEKDVTTSNGELFTDIRSLNNYKAARFIRKGAILKQNYLKRIPVVNKGDKIKAKFVDGNVMIQLDVIARNEGYIGEIIRVMKGNKYFKAKIIDSQNVLIME